MMLMMMVAALAVTQAEEPRRPIGPPTDATFASARRALDGELLDYPSARFRDVTANALRVCGKVNSKNRVGAYVGWTDFVVVTHPEGADAFIGDRDMIETFCGSIRPTSEDQSERLTHR